MVLDANASANPRTVVVHLNDASIALSAVVRLGWLHTFASVAPFKQSFFEVVYFLLVDRDSILELILGLAVTSFRVG